MMMVPMIQRAACMVVSLVGGTLEIGMNSNDGDVDPNPSPEQNLLEGAGRSLSSRRDMLRESMVGDDG